MTEPNTAMVETTEEQLPAIDPGNLLLNAKSMNQLFKLSQYYAGSKVVPQAYQGKPGDCFVAVELAARMNISPVLVMQSLYIVQGKPSWAGQMCKSLIDGCRKYARSEYVFEGEPMARDWGCYLQAIERATGRVVRGTKVTMQMAADEGWLNKNGSKWKTMPEQMMKYRAAAFFARAECPNVLMGFQTDDEVQDVHGYEEQAAERIMITLDGGTE